MVENQPDPKRLLGDYRSKNVGRYTVNCKSTDECT